MYLADFLSRASDIPVQCRVPGYLTGSCRSSDTSTPPADCSTQNSALPSGSARGGRAASAPKAASIRPGRFSRCAQISMGSPEVARLAVSRAPCSAGDAGLLLADLGPVRAPAVRRPVSDTGSPVIVSAGSIWTGTPIAAAYGRTVARQRSAAELITWHFP